jgi:hypothetical protein
VGIPGFGDFQGAVGTVGNLGLVFHRFHGPVFCTALRFRFGWGGGLSIRAVAAHHVRAESDGYGRIQMLVNGHGTSGQGMAKPGLFQLPVSIGNRYGVVLGHHALGLHGEDPVQIRTGRLAKGRAFLPGRDRELRIELCDVTRA